MYSRLLSDEQAAKAWFREYSAGLASVGISLGLTPRQHSDLEHRLVAVCQSFHVVTVTKGRVRPDAVVDRLVDPVISRWLADHGLVQGETSISL